MILKFLEKKLLSWVFPCLYRNISVSTKNLIKEQASYDYVSHIPVMADEVIEALAPFDKGCYLDMTFGAGGHSKRIARSASDIKLYCLDRDPVAYDIAVQFAKQESGNIFPLLGKFSELESLFFKAKVSKNSLDGILIDAGCSSMQMDEPSRGFSISKNGPLDMRMDGNRCFSQPTAADILNSLDVPSIARILKTYGEERLAKKIAQALFDARYLLKTINTTHELSDIVYSAVGGDERTDKLNRPAHVATKVFQAIRIFVNNELNELNYAIDFSYEFLKPGGKLVVLTFHSLEDRVVKRHIQGIDMDEPVSHTMAQKYRNASMWHHKELLDDIYTHRWIPLYKNVITPSYGEIESNPRSRSAKLRAAIKNYVSDNKS